MDSTACDADFRRYCESVGAVILRTLQEGRRGKDCRAWTYLVRDADGIVKVFKEMKPAEVTRGRVGPTEKEVYDALGNREGFPRLHGMTVVEGREFLRIGVCYGDALDGYCDSDRLLSPDAASAIIGRIAAILAGAPQLLHGDIKPANVIAGDAGVSLIDLDSARLVRDDEEEVAAVPRDVAYSAPEMFARLRASRKSDVFSLAVLWYALCTGRQFSPEANPLAAGLPTLQQELLGSMLVFAPHLRPPMAEIAAVLDSPGNITLRPHRAGPPPAACTESQRPLAIFVARLGIPHRGHIAYMRRVIDLGFDLVISLQRTYTCTEDDPLPKWVVAKMVAQSLFDLGVPAESFRFVYTPFFSSRQNMQWHFAMMPGAEQLRRLVTGNDDVPSLFPHLPVIDQSAVFGVEGEPFVTRSWGTDLRAAVRRSDRAAFADLAASGVERVWPFDEIAARYCECPVDFIEGRVWAHVRWDKNKAEFTFPVRRYIGPEASVVYGLRDLDLACEITDLYDRDPSLTVDGESFRLAYERTTVEGKDLIIDFRLS